MRFKDGMCNGMVPTRLAKYRKEAPLPTSMQSFIWPAMASESDVVVIDEFRAGNPNEFMQPLVFDLYWRQGKRTAVCIIAPDFEGVVAIQRSWQELTCRGPGYCNNMVGIQLLSIGGAHFGLNHVPYVCRGDEARTFEWEFKSPDRGFGFVGCDIFVCSASSIIE